MFKKLRIGAVMGLLALASAPALASATASHGVTVTVSAINEVGITGGALNLTINTATAGSEPDAVSDAATAHLDWTTNEASKKITVASGIAISGATLTVHAVSVTGGTAASEVTLGATATDFVTGIGTTTGGCDLSYTASSLASDGTSNNTYTITYTITAETV